MLVGLSLVSLLLYFHSDAEQLYSAFIVLTYIYEICFNFSIGAITLLYVAEILPLNGYALSYAANWLISTLISIIGPMIVHFDTDAKWKDNQINYLYLCIVLLVFAICCVLGYYLVHRYVIEIKDITKKQIKGITHLYSGKYKKH